MESEIEIEQTEQPNAEYMEAFNAPEETELTVAQIDTAIKAYALLREDYEEKKDASTNAKNLMDKQEDVILEMLDKVGKKSFTLDGVGVVTKKTSFSVTTPKTNEDKALLFKWLKENLGADGFLAYASVNSASLNSLYNTMYEEATNKMEFKIDGVGEPTDRVTLSFRRVR